MRTRIITLKQQECSGSPSGSLKVMIWDAKKLMLPTHTWIPSIHNLQNSQNAEFYEI